MLTESKILNETIQLLENRHRKLTLIKISQDLNIDVTWLTKITNGTIPNPGIVTVEKLNEYLKNYIPE